MFVIACGYVLRSFLTRFATNSIRQRNFFIPSQTDNNLLWGFAFYLGFAALMFHSPHKIWPLIGIIIIFAFLLYYRSLRKNIISSSSPFIIKDLRRRLEHQQANDNRLNRPYTRSEALRLLGLPIGIDDNNPQITERLQLLSDFSFKNPNLPYLPKLIDELRAAFSQK